VKSVSVADFSCRRLGTVIGQSPAAGSRLFTGETVTIRVAVRPITFCP
jgi:beta-lactam-binding protein with PASTA domain